MFIKTNVKVNNKSLPYQTGAVFPKLQKVEIVRWSIKLQMKRACRSGRDQSLLILCSGAVYYFLYFRNASTYVELLWDFVLPGGPGKSVPTQVLELPSPESKFN